MAQQEILLESGTNEMELLTFMLGDQLFGLNVVKVQSIMQFDSSLVSKIPEAPAALLGMMLHRDRTIPLVDLSTALNMQNTIESEREIVIVTEFNNVVSGFKVDGVNQINRLSWKAFTPIGDFIGRSSEGIIGSVNLDETEALVVDLEYILAKIIPSMAIKEPTDETLETKDRQSRGNIRIVFAEDSKTIRNSLVRILKNSGFSNVKAFNNGKDAYNALSAINESSRQDDLPHAIISDIEMPKMDGLTFCKKLKKDLGLKQIPFIIFSSLINEQMVRKCKSVGADSYITKPETNKLMSMLDEICLQTGRADSSKLKAEDRTGNISCALS